MHLRSVTSTGDLMLFFLRSQGLALTICVSDIKHSLPDGSYNFITGDVIWVGGIVAHLGSQLQVPATTERSGHNGGAKIVCSGIQEAYILAILRIPQYRCRFP
jgi:hypothetical protein